MGNSNSETTRMQRCVLYLSITLMMNMCTSTPTSCECTNPYENIAQSHLGDPERLCQYARVCFVHCKSGCKDEFQGKGKFGEGKCASTMACELRKVEDDEKKSFSKSGAKAATENVIPNFFACSPFCYRDGTDKGWG